MTVPATYTGTNQQQGKDGGPCPWKDCVPTGFATVTDGQTAGMVILSPPAIRKAAGVSCTTGTGGLTQQAAANGVKILTGLVWTPRYSLNRQQVADAIRAFGGIEISILYRRILAYSWRNSATFTGGHGTAIIDIRTNPITGVLEVHWGDPLSQRGFQWVAASVIFAAAEDRGGGVINIAVPPDAREASRKTLSSTPLRTLPNVTALAKRTLPTGTIVRVRRPVVGGSWTIGTKTGIGWWEVDQIGGVPISPVLYAAAGRLR